MINFSPVSFQGNIQTKEKQKKNIKGGLTAVGANTLASLSSLPIGLLAMNRMTKISTGLSDDEIKLANDGAKKILEEITNLSQKGVKINNFTFGGINLTSMPNWLYETINPIYATAKGKNAAFVPHGSKKDLRRLKMLGIEENSIIVNKNKLPLATFHEMGHAFNYNNSSFWKAIQKTRTPLMLLALLVSLIPAFTKDSKPQDGQELTKGEKFINGLRKACPFLAGGMMLPMFAEELKATLRGNAWAKEVLNSDLAKKVAKGNVWGLVSYAGTIVAVGLTAFVTKKVKDRSDEKIAFKSQINAMHEKNYKPTINAHQG